MIFDVKCSAAPRAGDPAAGGVPLMWKTGHSLIKAKMREIGAPIAGEMSGHIFFGERWYGFDDATHTAARMLEILSRARTRARCSMPLPASFSTPRAERALCRGRTSAWWSACRPAPSSPARGWA